jgi:hypothetical protein
MLAMGAAVTACASDGTRGDASSEEQGTLAVPMKTYANSGTVYRLRDAEFEVTSAYKCYEDYDATSPAMGGSAGGPTDCWPQFSTVLSSEEDPDADSVAVSVEQGEYSISLRPGWRLEKVENGVAETVEATLLNGAYQWVWVAPRSTSWVEYQFGIGDRQIWMNGQLNVGIRVFEDPNELGTGGTGGYPTGGAAGDTNEGGAPWTGGSSSGGTGGTASGGAWGY